jgi:hypothetical protein
MLAFPRKSIAVIALTGAMAVSAATPSEARWFGRGWGWGAAGLGIGIAAGAAIASAAASPYYGYGYGYGYPAYGYDYGYPGYAAYGYGYGPAYASYGYGYPASYGYASYGYGGYGYGYGGPSISVGWGSPGYGYGYAAPGYYGSRTYIYASRSNQSYRVARSSASRTAVAHARTGSAQRAYAMAPTPRVHNSQRVYRAVAKTNGVKATKASASVSNVRKPAVAAQRHAAGGATATISR